METLAASLREPQAVQLEYLALSLWERGAGGAVMGLLDALRGRAGTCLKTLIMQAPFLQEDESMQVASRAVDIINAGGLPAMSFWRGQFSIDGVGSLAYRKVVDALIKREDAQWYASW